MALKPRHGTWAYGPDAHTPADAARALAWGGPEDPGDWQPVTRAFRDGHAETWRAADATLGWRGPDGLTRLVVATADPGTLPDKATWYLTANLPRPGGPREGQSLGLIRMGNFALPRKSSEKSRRLSSRTRPSSIPAAFASS